MTKALLFLLLFTFVHFGFPVLAQEEKEKEKEKQIHPCSSELTLDDITSFIVFNFRAAFGDLKSNAVKTWIEHHKIQKFKVNIVRIFRSPFFPQLAIVSARVHTNYNLVCAVRLNTDEIKDDVVLYYTDEELEKILSKKPDTEI